MPKPSVQRTADTHELAGTSLIPLIGGLSLVCEQTCKYTSLSMCCVIRIGLPQTEQKRIQSIYSSVR